MKASELPKNAPLFTKTGSWSGRETNLDEHDIYEALDATDTRVQARCVSCNVAFFYNADQLRPLTAGGRDFQNTFFSK